MKFTDLAFEYRPSSRMRQAIVAFDNGYSASVVIGPYSYGGRDGLYELAVLKAGEICYDTPITDDVIGHLKETDVDRILAEIEALPEAAK